MFLAFSLLSTLFFWENSGHAGGLAGYVHVMPVSRNSFFFFECSVQEQLICCIQPTADLSYSPHGNGSLLICCSLARPRHIRATPTVSFRTHWLWARASATGLPKWHFVAIWHWANNKHRLFWGKLSSGLNGVPATRGINIRRSMRGVSNKSIVFIRLC